MLNLAALKRQFFPNIVFFTLLREAPPQTATLVQGAVWGFAIKPRTPNRIETKRVSLASPSGRNKLKMQSKIYSLSV